MPIYIYKTQIINKKKKKKINYSKQSDQERLIPLCMEDYIAVIILAWRRRHQTSPVIGAGEWIKEVKTERRTPLPENPNSFSHGHGRKLKQKPFGDLGFSRLEKLRKMMRGCKAIYI